MSSIITGFHYDIGNRDIYEDRVDTRVLTTPSGLNLAVAVVADGVGGENQGEVAAEMAKEAVFDYLENSQETDVPTMLTQAVTEANEAVYTEMHATGASSTLAVAVIVNGKTLYIANVGDSRIYLCRNDKVTQLTIDHTFATVMPWQKKLSPEAAREHPQAEVLMRAIGPKPQVVVDVGFYVGITDFRKAQERGRKGLPLREGDSILVCSDGLIKESPRTGKPFTKKEEITQVLTTQEGDKAARSLVSFALGRNADDNVSVALLQMPDPKRKQRAIVPIYWIAGAAAGILVLAIIIFFLISQARINSNVEAVAEEAATKEFIIQQTVIARETEVAVEQQAVAAADIESVNAASTAAAQALADSAVATSAALDATAASISASENIESTAIAEETRCLAIDNFGVEVLGEPVLEPPAPYIYVQGAQLPEISASWLVKNNGSCPWYDIRLRTLAGTGEDIVPQIEIRQVGGVLIQEVPAGETVEIALIFERPGDETDYLDTEFYFVVGSSGGDMALVNQPRLSLGVEDWILSIDPSPTPTSTPTPLPTATPPPTQPSGGGGNGSGGGPPDGRG